jgi:hypothetical protein
VTVAVLATHLQCAHGRRECINTGNVSGVTHVCHRELENGAQLAICVSRWTATRDLPSDVEHFGGSDAVFRIPTQLTKELDTFVEAVPHLICFQRWAIHTVEDAFFDRAPSNWQDGNMLMNDGLGDLGFGWKSFAKVGSIAKGIGKGAYNVASMPVKLALKAANATSSVLCAGGGNTTGNPQDAQTAASFCKAMKAKDSITVRKLLPRATAVASRAAAIQKAYKAPMQGAFGDALSIFKTWGRDDAGNLLYADQSPKAIAARMRYVRANDLDPSEATTPAGSNDNLFGISADDMNLLAALNDADQDDLAFALSGVDPSEIGAVMTTNEMVAFAPATIAVAAGLWMLLRG